MTDIQSNVRIRINVVSFDDFIGDVTAFQRSLSWEELHQYVWLYWMNRETEVMASLTPSQRAERKQFEDFRIRLVDPYSRICDQYRFLLRPVRPVMDEGAAQREQVPEASVIQPNDPTESRPTSVNIQDRVTLAPLTARQLVIAPPGTGKTHTVIQRLVHLAGPDLLCGDLTPVLIVSFSRAAAAELCQRLALETMRRQGAIYQQPRISTLDSFAGSVLSFVLPGRMTEGYDENIRLLAAVLEGQEGITIRDQVVQLVRQRIRVVVVDEVQDIVGVRARLVCDLLAALAGTEHGVLMLGDLRQAIYGFQLRDSAIPWQEEQSMDAYWLIRKVAGLYEDLEKISFSQQYRFSPSCQRLMARLEAAMDDPVGKMLPGEQPDRAVLRECLEELPVLEDPIELANEDAKRERIAILARTNREVRKLEVGCSQILQRFGRKLRVVGRAAGRGYPGWIGRVFGGANPPGRFTREGFLHAYATRVSGDAREAEERLEWLVTAFGINKDGFPQQEITDGIKRNPDVPTDLREQPRPGEIWISTIHQAKGREFDTVVIANLNQILGNHGTDPEECRVAYVAATRARRNVYRCAGRYWLPTIFDWEFKWFDRIRMCDPSHLDEQSWHQAQDELWRAFRGLGRLRMHHTGNGEFGLEAEAAGGKTILKLPPEFTHSFLRFARERLRIDAPLDCEYTVRITDLRTVATGNQTVPLILLPELSGRIERIS
ncbi:MAG: UvrD-helicase domain-containing protein [Planctomycetota bacterium]|nr:UvrD-helicase domain-containing protein [Planctomycetota bacterium]